MLKVRIQEHLKVKSRIELEKIVNEYYRTHFQGKCVVNEETKFEICFNVIGRKKTAFGGRRASTIMTAEKVTAILYLKELLQTAKYIGVVNPKPKHIQNYNALGLFIFMVNIIINDVKKSYKLTCMLNKGGKFHYAINEDYNK